MEVCLAGNRREVEVSLVDRSSFEYPMLVGRRALKHFALVDSGETFLSAADCRDHGNKTTRGEEAPAGANSEEFAGAAGTTWTAGPAAGTRGNATATGRLPRREVDS
jgi:hypothetical protein